jgi:hypothetical protein
MMAEDLDIFFGEFAREASAVVNGEQRAFRAILTEDVMDVDGVIQSVPTCRAKTSDLNDVKIRSEIVFGDRRYAVTNRMDDGAGMTDLILRKL